MENMELEDRLALIEFRQQLLFENTEFSRFLFETKVTKEQLDRIFDLMDALSEEIREEKLITHSSYEQQIYEIVPAKRGNYHFAESISRILHEGRRWPEVFEHVYGSMEKFKSYLNKK
ncbi:DUF1878 family protein [Bacillus cereus]|uniref:DUF1878 domain-containing protein n=1 Tax=Bacillus cereus (strain VD146) TaxID=1053236 RepID=R8NJH1_BACCX|nr:DUF1878 family protein [Bacillus cereus]EOP46640.1 hypothetical protein IK1_06049 [Bacillus cereus VD146]